MLDDGGGAESKGQINMCLFGRCCHLEKNGLLEEQLPCSHNDITNLPFFDFYFDGCFQCIRFKWRYLAPLHEQPVNHSIDIDLHSKPYYWCRIHKKNPTSQQNKKGMPRARVRVTAVNPRPPRPIRPVTTEPPALPPAGKGAQYYLPCPHCGGLVTVYEHEINCTIFRHGILKSTGKQINPHTPKAECDRLAREKLIFGCGKPFKFDGHKLEICDYI